MKIVILGYMSCGKSTIGEELAKMIAYKFIDLDNYIETQENKLIPKLFEDKGELYFRLKESEYLKDILESENDFVLSLGGGTPCYSNNIELITANHIKSFYLKSSIEILVNRLMNDKNSRPLIKNITDDKLTEFVSKHLLERSSYYMRADKIISINNKSKEVIIEEIKSQL